MRIRAVEIITTPEDTPEATMQALKTLLGDDRLELVNLSSPPLLATRAADENLRRPGSLQPPAYPSPSLPDPGPTAATADTQSTLVEDRSVHGWVFAIMALTAATAYSLSLFLLFRFATALLGGMVD